MPTQRPCVLVFAGHDPSGGAGIQADIEAIAAQGAHALTIITALTVQDNNRVYAVHAVDAAIIQQQAQALMDNITIAAVKIGIVGNRNNALAIAQIIQRLREKDPQLPVVLDTVLRSGNGDALGQDDAVEALQPLLKIASLITPNLPEARRLAPDCSSIEAQARQLFGPFCGDVLIKGGHGSGDMVSNSWFTRDAQREWRWSRLPGEFHGSGCTLAAAIAGQLALGENIADSLQAAQEFSQCSLQHAFSIAAGQLIPQRILN